MSWGLPLSIFCIFLSSTAFTDDKDSCADKLLSQSYRGLERDNQKTRDWVERQTSKTLERLSKSPSHPAVAQLVSAAFNQPRTLKNKKFKQGGQLLLSFLDAATGRSAVTLVDAKGHSLVLLDSADLSKSRKKPLSFWDIALSPDENHFVLTFTVNGSTDAFEHLIYDIKGKKVATKLKASGHPVVWEDSDNLLFENPDGGITKYRLSTGSSFIWSLNGSISTNEENLPIVYKGEQPVLLDSGNEYEFPRTEAGLVVGTDGKDVFIRSRGDSVGTGMVSALDLKDLRSGKFPVPEIVVPEHAFAIKKVFYNKGTLFVVRFDGKAQVLHGYDRAGNIIYNIEIPNCCSVLGASWKSKNKKLILQLSSEIVKSKPFIYSIADGEFEEDPAVSMLTGKDGTIYQAVLTDFKSYDGVRIPVRLVYKAGLLDSQKAKHPVLLSSYGGFNHSAYFFPSYALMAENFLSRGGILASPALRGGNEISTSWWSSTKEYEKQTTFYDLIAVTEGLIEKGWTIPEKIISTGTSNGGLTVAATSLLRPDLFGLTIPVNGVLDMLARNRLDSDFDGWNGEYGNAKNKDLSEFLADYSPLELAGKVRARNFLIINGRDDSRVAPAHSFKLALALNRNQRRIGKCYLLSLKKSGHWIESPLYDSNAVAAQTVIWTAIFDQLGWTK